MKLEWNVSSHSPALCWCKTQMTWEISFSSDLQVRPWSMVWSSAPWLPHMLQWMSIWSERKILLTGTWNPISVTRNRFKLEYLWWHPKTLSKLQFQKINIWHNIFTREKKLANNHQTNWNRNDNSRLWIRGKFKEDLSWEIIRTRIISKVI